jgi:hypothetical protein
MGLSENNKPALPVGSPELKLEMATVTGLNCQRVHRENRGPWASWRSERDSNSRYRLISINTVFNTPLLHETSARGDSVAILETQKAVLTDGLLILC